ncbi:hypothetical protein LCGC14_1825910 [marine sediment metagenome]|uniref:Uncharacterized protein n=1 Tax=marine sediment metagenome TaxID=412755 RepID=A0A0F9IX84_9ZZZZ
MAKEAPDYTASGVNLCNPPEVRELLDLYIVAQNQAWAAQEAIEAVIPEDLKEGNSAASVALGDARNALRAAVEEHGGYQDVGTETYALFQVRRTPQYSIVPFLGMKKYEQFVPLVVKNTIDPDALKGQIRGKLLTEAELVEDGVITYKETQAFILKVPEAN